jgi:hypothetical protein
VVTQYAAQNLRFENSVAARIGHEDSFRLFLSERFKFAFSRLKKASVARNIAKKSLLYIAIHLLEEFAARAKTISPAETFGRLNQKFFGRRVDTIFSSPRPQSRVFSKNFLRQLHDGTTQVSGWGVAVALKQSLQK